MKNDTSSIRLFLFLLLAVLAVFTPIHTFSQGFIQKAYISTPRAFYFDSPKSCSLLAQGGFLKEKREEEIFT
ncbi:MAG: hypothetical protein M3Q56_00150, partial [Bacteroidota bacterium]|nr:hypothetical protein [Bacteroidota bacterium]